MTTFGPLAKQAHESFRHSADAGATMMLLVDLTPRAWATQYAAGAPINDVTPAHFTGGNLSPTRIPQIILGPGGGAVTYTIIGTDPNGAAQTEALAFTVAATKKFTKAFATITSLTSNVDPVGTTDLQAGDTMDAIPSRGIIVAGAGAIAMQLEEDAAVQTSPSIPVGEHAYHVKRINITNTAATGLALLF